MAAALVGDEDFGADDDFVVDGMVPSGPMSASSADRGVVVLLRRASLLVDEMWRAAATDGASPSAVHLGEASQGIHRALIALTALERPGAV